MKPILITILAACLIHISCQKPMAEGHHGESQSAHHDNNPGLKTDTVSVAKRYGRYGHRHSYDGHHSGSSSSGSYRNYEEKCNEYRTQAHTADLRVTLAEAKAAVAEAEAARVKAAAAAAVAAIAAAKAEAAKNKALAAFGAAGLSLQDDIFPSTKSTAATTPSATTQPSTTDDYDSDKRFKRSDEDSSESSGSASAENNASKRSDSDDSDRRNDDGNRHYGYHWHNWGHHDNDDDNNYRSYISACQEYKSKADKANEAIANANERIEAAKVEAKEYSAIATSPTTATAA